MEYNYTLKFKQYYNLFHVCIVFFHVLLSLSLPEWRIDILISTVSQVRKLWGSFHISKTVQSGLQLLRNTNTKAYPRIQQYHF